MRTCTSYESDDLDWLGRGTAVGPWIVARELGRGGMSTVYEVAHALTQRRAALKLARLDPTDEPITAACFLLEARCAYAVRHPGSVEVFEAGAFAGRPYLVMEALDGETLGAAFDRGPIAPALACAVIVELCDVLAAAHAAGVVHRDVKLDNVFLLKGGVRRTKLFDWGVARLVGEEDPWAGMMAGTPQYVAPEQARGHEVTAATDVYALGVLAYLLLVGHLPFRADSATRLMRMHCKSRPPRMRCRRAVPHALSGVVGAMLEKRAEDRPTLTEIKAAFAGTPAAR